MLLIPAIDLKNGECVRLRQGRMDDVTVFSKDPVAMAQRWADEGAERLHVVDLDGAMKGEPINLKVVEAIEEDSSQSERRVVAQLIVTDLEGKEEILMKIFSGKDEQVRLDLRADDILLASGVALEQEGGDNLLACPVSQVSVVASLAQ